MKYKSGNLQYEFLPWQCYIELHKHNNELCYLGQQKNQVQVAQFSGKAHPNNSKYYITKIKKRKD